MNAPAARPEWTLSEGEGERMVYTIEASDLKGLTPVRCPECRAPLFLGAKGLTEHHDDEGELIKRSVECRTPRCGALFEIFND